MMYSCYTQIHFTIELEGGQGGKEIVWSIKKYF